MAEKSSSAFSHEERTMSPETETISPLLKLQISQEIMSLLHKKIAMIYIINYCTSFELFGPAKMFNFFLARDCLPS